MAAMVKLYRITMMMIKMVLYFRLCSLVSRLPGARGKKKLFGVMAYIEYTPNHHCKGIVSVEIEKKMRLAAYICGKEHFFQRLFILRHACSIQAVKIVFYKFIVF